MAQIIYIPRNLRITMRMKGLNLEELSRVYSDIELISKKELKGQCKRTSQVRKFYIDKLGIEAIFDRNGKFFGYNVHTLDMDRGLNIDNYIEYGEELVGKAQYSLAELDEEKKRIQEKTG
jgi:hypothetical protein